MRAAKVWRRRLQPPRAVLASLVLLHWGVVAAVALSVDRNGWLFFQGGDQTWYYTTGWTLSEGNIPPSVVGYGLPYVLAPIAWIAGPNFLAALPLLLLLQTLVLAPAALLAVYGIARSIAGRRIGYLAAATWVLAPVVAIPLFNDRYHERYVDQFLPQLLGLTGMADYPSMVALLVAAYLLVRGLETRDWLHIATAGLVTGFACGIKPSNLVFAGAPVLALLAARRLAHVGVFAAALAPALLTLALWKQRGLGKQPAFALEHMRVEGAAGLPVADISSKISRAVDSYIRLDWDRLVWNLDQIREYFWSVRLLEWLVVAGIVAVARRSPPKALLLGAWLASYVVFKGSSPESSFQSGSFLRLVMPGMPPLPLFLAALPLLVPGYRPRREEPPSGRPRTAALAALALLTLAPLVVVAVARPLHEPVALRHYTEGVFLTVDASLTLSQERLPGEGVRLRWRAPETRGTDAYYTVYRVLRDNDVRCEYVPEVADLCLFDTDQLGFTTKPELVDYPPAGTWTYRVALSANHVDQPRIGDALMLSEPLTVRVKREGKRT